MARTERETEYVRRAVYWHDRFNRAVVVLNDIGVLVRAQARELSALADAIEARCATLRQDEDQTRDR